MFFSEHLFWARARPGDTLANWAATWLAYSLLAFVFLSAVRHYRVRSLDALFVAGALVGWLGEGVVVQTLYDQFPLQISWTGLAWHSLISVCFGWFAMLCALASRSVWRTAALAAGAGAFWGWWAIFWWLEEPASVTPLLAFAAYAFATTGVLAVNYWAFSRLGVRDFAPGRGSILAATALLLLVFIVGTVPAVPMAVVVLPVLLALILVALTRNRAAEAERDLLTDLGAEKPPLRAYVPLGLIPVIATLIYALALGLGLRWPTNWLVYLVTMPAGFILFAVSWIRLMRRKPIRV